jgi:hypothetical protein
MKKSALLALLGIALGLAASIGAAHGQGAILQGGPWAPGRAPMYVGQGSSQAVMQDSGPASGGGVGIGLSELLLTARGTGTPPYAGQGTGPYGTNNCDYDGPTTNAAGYHYLCFSANAQGSALIAIGAGGVAAPLGLNVIVNGATYGFPASGAGTGNVVGPSSSTVSHLACWNNTAGTLLSDCGPPQTGNVTLGGANAFTGSNSFSQPIIADSASNQTVAINIFSRAASGPNVPSGGIYFNGYDSTSTAFTDAVEGYDHGWLFRDTIYANGLQLSAAATGNSPAIAAQGTDTNVTLTLSGQGTGVVAFPSVIEANSGSDNTVAINIFARGGAGASVPSAGIYFNGYDSGSSPFTDAILGSNHGWLLRDTIYANGLQLSAAATGNSPAIAAQGTDTNVALTLSGQGTGDVISISPVLVQSDTEFTGYQVHNSTATVAVLQGFASNNDNGGLVLKSANVENVQIYASGPSQIIGGPLTVANDLVLLGSSSGATTFASANAGATNYTITVPAASGSLVLNSTNNWTSSQTITSSTIFTGWYVNDGTNTVAVLQGFASGNDNGGLILKYMNVENVQIYANGASQIVGGPLTVANDLVLLGSSTGGTTFASANSGASNYTVTVPAVTGDLMLDAANGLFSVSNYSNGAAGAIAAAQAAGGGWIVYPAGTFTAAALTIPTGVNVLCAGINATTIQPGSGTGNIFNVTGYSVIAHCKLQSFGTPGTSQTAGSFINLTGAWATIDDIWCDGYFVCLTLNNGVAHVHDIVANNGTQRTTQAGSAAVLCEQGGSVMVSHLTMGTTANPSSQWPTYGVLVNGATSTCPLQLTDSSIVDVQYGLALLPAAGKAACIISANNYYDTDLNPVILQPQANTGLICNASFIGDRFNITGSSTSTTPAAILVDTNTNGGTVSSLVIQGTQNVSYTTANGACITLSGSGLGPTTIIGNSCGITGELFYDGFSAINGASNFILSGNDFMVSGGDAIQCSGGGTGIIDALNQVNGGTVSTSGCTISTVPTTGTAQTWTAAQTFTNSDLLLLGSSTGATTFTSANSSATNYTITVPAITDTLATDNGATQITVVSATQFTGFQVHNSGQTVAVLQGNSATNDDGWLVLKNGGTTGVSLLASGASSITGGALTVSNDLVLLGSSTGGTTFASANSSATNYTLTIPAATGTLVVTSAANTWTALQQFTNGDFAVLGSSTGYTLVESGLSGSSNNTLTLPVTSSDTLAALGTAQTWTAAQTFTNGDLLLKGSSSGSMTLEAPAAASTYVMTFPALTDTVATNNGSAAITITSGGNEIGFQVHCASCGTGSASETVAVLQGNNSNNDDGILVLKYSNGGSPSTLVQLIAGSTSFVDGAFSVGLNTNTGTGLTTFGTNYMTGMPTTTPGGTISAVCWSNTAGELWTDTSATICGVSAERFKDIREDFISPETGLAGILSLRTNLWQYKPEYNIDDSRVHIGPIADDVAALDSQCGSYESVDREGKTLISADVLGVKFHGTHDNLEKLHAALHRGATADDITRMVNELTKHDEEQRLYNFNDRCLETFLIAGIKRLNERLEALEAKRQ